MLDPPDRESALLWIEQNQLARRNLSDDQRAVIAESILRRKSEQARREQAKRARKAVQARNPVKTSDVSVNVSDTSPRPGNGTPGEPAPKKVPTAAPPKPKRDTRAAVAREHNVPERKLRTVREIRKKKPEALEQVRSGKNG